jgi:quinol monooxygenase YgiN
VTGPHDYSDLHELIERLEPEQAEELRAFVLRLIEPGRRTPGSLRGQLSMTPDWDSDEVNDAIARDFHAPE